ncbi:MAG TPA: hypothetical protein VMY88_05080 [Acidimicrobiales bacterium]|nr:hypothetical protein [Acidimicrobiales bacterium]
MSTAVVLAVVRRPDLWLIAVQQMFRMARRSWWRRAPFLPTSDPEYLRFRSVTQYGDAEHAAEPRDVVAWLEWCRNVRS